MVETYKSENYLLKLYINGSDKYQKTSYPLRNGVYSELETKDSIIQFDSGGQIQHAKGKTRDWLHPQEWLKRTVGNDWVYYSTGGYSGVFETIGEFYLPNFRYPTNSLMGGKPFEEPVINNLVNTWYETLQAASRSFAGVSGEVQRFFSMALKNTPERLAKKAEALFQISGGRITVLPPDARHVDYDIIPLMVSEGCLYKCRFCKVKSANEFRVKTHDEIAWQLDTLRELYGENLKNFNSVFLGEHDALHSGSEVVLHAVAEAMGKFELTASYMRGVNFFLFASVDSLLAAPEQFFVELKKLPCNFYINVGLESADQETLDFLGKPIASGEVKRAFFRSQFINDTYLNIEVTSNFVMDSELPGGHYPAFLNLVRESLNRNKPKGCVYLSPLRFGQPKRELLFTFNRFKVLSRLPTFLYIIQRL